jgi:hypothetical protein
LVENEGIEPSLPQCKCSAIPIWSPITLNTSTNCFSPLQHYVSLMYFYIDFCFSTGLIPWNKLGGDSLYTRFSVYIVHFIRLSEIAYGFPPDKDKFQSPLTWWTVMDLNHRAFYSSDLQSDAINPSANCPLIIYTLSLCFLISV